MVNFSIVKYLIKFQSFSWKLKIFCKIFARTIVTAHRQVPLRVVEWLEREAQVE